MLMRFLVTWLSCLLFASFVQASDEDAAKHFAQSTADRAAEILQSDKSDETKRQALEKMFIDVVDTKWISRFVIGRYWRDMSKAQQDDYSKYYQEFLVKHYTSNFQEYTRNTEFSVTRSRDLSKKGQSLVSMDIKHSDNPSPIKIDYRLREKSGKFQIIDIVVEGVSLLNTQRSEFSSVIQREGADYLIQQLKQRSQEEPQA